MTHDGIELDPKNKSHSKGRLKEYGIIRKKRGYNASDLTPREYLDASCSIHCFKGDEVYLMANHALKDCRLFVKFSKRLKEKKLRQNKRTRRTSPAPSTKDH